MEKLLKPSAKITEEKIFWQIQEKIFLIQNICQVSMGIQLVVIVNF